MTSIQEQDQWSSINIDATLACREIQIVSVNHMLNKNEVEDALDTIKRNYINNNDVGAILRIVTDLLTNFLHNNTPKHRRQGETLLIIDNIKPYLMHCLVPSIGSIKYEWLAYHLTKAKEGQVFIPDFVLYLKRSWD